MKLKQKLLNAYLCVFGGYALMNYPYCKEWDDKFNELLDNNNFVITDRTYAKLGDVTLWTSNRPYACFEKKIHLTASYNITVRPSRLTIYKALKKLNAEFERLKQVKVKQI